MMRKAIIIITDFKKDEWKDFIAGLENQETTTFKIIRQGPMAETSKKRIKESHLALKFQIAGSNNSVVLARQHNEEQSNNELISDIIAIWLKNSEEIALCVHKSGGTLSDAKKNFPQVKFYEPFHHCDRVCEKLKVLFDNITNGDSFDNFWKFMESQPDDVANRSGLFEHMTALDILVQGYLAAIYIANDALKIENLKESFKVFTKTKGLRSHEELSKEASEGKLAPSRLFRPLCLENDLVCDDTNGKASPKPFEDLAECNYWFDSVLYEVYSDCPETLSGNPSFFTNATDTEVQDLAKFIGTDNDAKLLRKIFGTNQSLTAAGALCPKLCSGDQQVYKEDYVEGGAIRTIWELIRSGLNNEVAKHHSSVYGDATEIVKSLGQLFFRKSSGAVNREDVIEALFSFAFLEFGKVHELVSKAVARKKKLKNFREQRTRLNHNYLKNDFLSIFGPFRGSPYDVDSISQELLKLDHALDKHNDAINSWNERIKPELLEFFNRDSFGPNIKPLKSFKALDEDCRKRIEVLDHFVVKVWPGFFQLEINAKSKETKSFFATGINLYQALRSLRVELDFFKYFSVSD